MGAVYFKNKKVTLPGVYSTIVSGETNPPRISDYGTALIIDTGLLGAGYGGGAGINGQLAGSQNAVYTFNTIEEFRNFVKGGMYWRAAQALFYPEALNNQATGISQLLFVRACTTKPATMTFTTTASGNFPVLTRDEGTWSNGVLSAATDKKLLSGYAYTVTPGVDDPAKFTYSIYRGTYTGTYDKFITGTGGSGISADYDGDGLPFGDETEEQANPILIITSPEVGNVAELITWANTSSAFNSMFALGTGAKPGVIVAADVTKVPGFNAAIGGTETYSPSDLDAALDAVTGTAYNAVLTDQIGSGAGGTENVKVITHVNNKSKFQRTVYIGTYGEGANFKSAIAIAKGLNSDNVVATFGDSAMNDQYSPMGYRWWSPFYTLCSVVGRVLGKAPQIPVTNKGIGVDRLKYMPTESQQVQSIESGLLCVVKSDTLKKFVVLQGVNTLQDNQYLFNAKGQSPSIQFMRIVHQINTDLTINASIDLLGQENGVNANTLSAGSVKSWTEVFLQSKVATEQTDNLILSFKNISVSRQEDAWFVTYCIAVNNEITKLFFTGFLVK